MVLAVNAMLGELGGGGGADGAFFRGEGGVGPKAQCSGERGREAMKRGLRVKLEAQALVELLGLALLLGELPFCACAMPILEVWSG